MKIIKRERSIIPACDCSFEVLKKIIRGTADVEGIGAYKVGVSFLDIGYIEVVKAVREHTDKPVIYDHQKGATDIHEVTPDQFMDSMLRSKINAVILFPQAGPVSEYEWINAAQTRGIGVIVGGEMTHPRYLEGDFSNGKNKNYTEIFRSLGIGRDITGFLRNTAPDDIYEIAAKMRVSDFVVPGNKPERIMHYKQLIESIGIKPTFYSPGFVAQGGEISRGAEAAGERFHGIVGRGIYEKGDIKENTLALTSRL